MHGNANRYNGSIEYDNEDDVNEQRWTHGGRNIRWMVLRDPDTDNGYRKGAQFSHTEVCMMLCLRAFTPGTMLMDQPCKRKHRVIITDGGIYTLSPYVKVHRWFNK